MYEIPRWEDAMIMNDCVLKILRLIVRICRNFCDFECLMLLEDIEGLHIFRTKVLVQ